MTITYQTIRDAMSCDFFDMEIADPAEIDAVSDAVNKSQIDSHLEACFCRSRGDKYDWVENKIGGKVVQRRLHCTVSKESFPTLLRRLAELADAGDPAAESLLTDILTVLEIPTEQVGIVPY
jgi:hypothetical protein